MTLGELRSSWLSNRAVFFKFLSIMIFQISYVWLYIIFKDCEIGRYLIDRTYPRVMRTCEPVYHVSRVQRQKGPSKEQKRGGSLSHL